MSSILSRNAALRGLLDQHLAALSQEEGLAPETITSAIEAGSMVLLGNPAHAGLAPIVVGQPSRIKVNANIGTSPLCNCLHTEKRKLAVALEAGADTVMDLSIAGDLDAIRTGMLAACPRPLGTVPMYSVGQQILDNDRDIASMQPDDLFAEIEKQTRQGVDFMTVHCGLTKRGAEMAVKQDRVMGVVSRGGSMLARWMLENGKENPLLEYFDRLIESQTLHQKTNRLSLSRNNLSKNSRNIVCRTIVSTLQKKPSLLRLFRGWLFYFLIFPKRESFNYRFSRSSTANRAYNSTNAP